MKRGLSPCGGERATDSCDRMTDGCTAFLLSMALPGMGQFWKGHASAPWWLLAGAMLIAGWELWVANGGAASFLLKYTSYLVFCLVASMHAVVCPCGLR
jgi:hypothetical protein